MLGYLFHALVFSCLVSLSVDGQQVATPAPPTAGTSSNLNIACANSAGVFVPGKHGVVPPKLIHAVNPEYTKEARKAKYQEVCVLKTLIDEEGHPQNIRVLQPISTDPNYKFKEAEEGLNRNAIRAVERYRFTPANCMGRPVPVEVTIEVNFRIN